jgi:hypothetical protein
MALTPQEYISRLQNLSANLQAQGVADIYVPAGNALRAKVINRIVNEGKGTNGQSLGQYSTTPAYYERQQFDKQGAFKPQGKRGSRPEAKTMYLEQGYRQLRDIQGKETGFKNFEYRGDMIKDFQQGFQSDNAFVIGFTDIVQSKKRKGNELKSGSAFAASDEELEAFNKEVAQGFAKKQEDAFK